MQVLNAGTEKNSFLPSFRTSGIQHVAPIEDFPLEKWNSMVSVMLTAPFLLTKYLLPKMKEKGESIISLWNTVNLDFAASF